ncbi:MAG: flavodoxin family protein [Victivallales bacterium]|nr:flavodoxin family protein [Victivallales bacterium]
MSKVILAISGSPRQKSLTEKMLDRCIEGLGEENKVYKFYPDKMNIEPCKGCMSCWKKNKGKCIHNDDFKKILQVYMRADYLLLAAPLYFSLFPGPLKNVIDRFFVLIDPEQRAGREGGTEHPVKGDRHPKTVLISSCGFPEIENFDLLRLFFRKLCKGMHWEHSGEILIPGAGAAGTSKLFNRKFELIKIAGAELLEGSVSKETTAAVARPVMSDSDYRSMCTAKFKGRLGKVKAAFIAIKAAYMKKPKMHRDRQPLLEK